MRSTKVVLSLCLLGGIAWPATSAAQVSSRPFDLEASGLVSAFHFERGSQSQWRTTSAIRFRAVVHDRVFGEFSFSAPIASKEAFSCIETEMGSCDPPDQAAWHFSILSGGLGMVFPVGAWKPFVGISGGRFKTEDESHGTWTIFSGLERSLGSWLGLVFEYRLGRVDWPYEGGVSLNHEVGVGLSISASTIFREGRSTP